MRLFLLNVTRKETVVNNALRGMLGLSLIACLATTTAAERLMSGRLGMNWPQALLASGSPSGDLQLAFGYIVDKKVAYGIAADFLWHTESQTVAATGGHLRNISDRQSFMFPVMFFFQVDPVPDLLIVHPAAHFNIGYNSMIYSYTSTDSSGSSPLHPYFYGLIIRAGVDGLYDMGKRSALFLSLEYQWANTSTSSTPEGIFDRMDMSGLSLAAGFRVRL